MQYSISWQQAPTGVGEFLRWLEICGEGFACVPTQFDYRQSGRVEHGVVFGATFNSTMPTIPENLLHNLEVFQSTLDISRESWMVIERRPASGSFVSDLSVYIYRADDKPIMRMDNKHNVVKSTEEVPAPAGS